MLLNPLNVREVEQQYHCIKKNYGMEWHLYECCLGQHYEGRVVIAGLKIIVIFAPIIW